MIWDRYESDEQICKAHNLGTFAGMNRVSRFKNPYNRRQQPCQHRAWKLAHRDVRKGNPRFTEGYVDHLTEAARE